MRGGGDGWPKQLITSLSVPRPGGESHRQSQVHIPADRVNERMPMINRTMQPAPEPRREPLGRRHWFIPRHGREDRELGCEPRIGRGQRPLDPAKGPLVSVEQSCHFLITPAAAQARRYGASFSFAVGRRSRLPTDG